MLIVAIGIVIASSLQFGCDQPQPISAQSPAAQIAPASSKTQPAEAPATSASEQGVMALVRGQAIPMSSLNEQLVQIYGLQASQQLIASELVRQEAQRQNITVTVAEENAENGRTLSRMFGQIDDANQRDQLLAQMLVRRDLSRQQWQWVMRRNALLRKIIEPTIEVTDEQIADEFALQFGRKVKVRHIQIASLVDAQDIIRRLKNGEDFIKLAMAESLNPTASDGGLLPEIGRKTTSVPPAIRNAALAMKTVGEVSDPSQVSTTCHILKLEESIDPVDVKIEDVSDQLADALREKLIAAKQQQVLKQLFQQAQQAGEIQYINPILKAQMDKLQQPAQ